MICPVGSILVKTVAAWTFSYGGKWVNVAFCDGKVDKTIEILSKKEVQLSYKMIGPKEFWFIESYKGDKK